MMQFFDQIFVTPIVNLLVAFYKLFLLGNIPGSFGLSIVALTVFIRFLMHPLFKKQMHTTKKIQELKPHLDKLSKEHKDDPKKVQQEQLRLYQEAGINPAAGCFFAIVQIPLVFGLYRTLIKFLEHGVGSKVVAEINKLLFSPLLQIQSLDPMFLGFNLALSPQKAHIWYYYLIPVVTAVLQYFQAQLAMPPTTSKIAVVEKKDGKTTEVASTEKKPEDDFQKIFSTQMKYMFPVLIGWTSFTFPVGLSLYWNIFSLFSIIQHILFERNEKKKKESSK
jgi:YidC/Oxa1 family membrane protein insertase